MATNKTRIVVVGASVAAVLALYLYRRSTASSNALQNTQTLKNNYYIVRHGKSHANLDKIISSDPQVGSRVHGLTAKGREQAEVAGQELAQSLARLWADDDQSL